MKKFCIPLVLLLSALLTACGFQPRGSVPQLDNIPQPLYISGIQSFSPLHRELSRQLQQASVELTEEGSSANSVLRIRDHSSGRRVFSVDSNNRAVEFELEESVKFSLLSADQGERIADQTVRVLRILYRPGSEVLAREREEEQLRDDMRRELVDRIMRRIKAQG